MRFKRSWAAVLSGSGLLVLGVTAADAADLPWGAAPPATALAYASVPAPVPYAVSLPAYGYEPLPVTDPCLRKPQPVTDPSGILVGYRVLRLCN